MCPTNVRRVPPLFSDRGGADEVAILSIEHSHAVANVAIDKKELKGGDLVGLQGWDQPCSRAVVESKTTHLNAGWVGKTIQSIVIFDVVRPLFLNRATIGIPVPIDLDDVCFGFVRRELSCARKGLFDILKRRIASSSLATFLGDIARRHANCVLSFDLLSLLLMLWSVSAPIHLLGSIQAQRRPRQAKACNAPDQLANARGSPPPCSSILAQSRHPNPLASRRSCFARRCCG